MGSRGPIPQSPAVRAINGNPGRRPMAPEAPVKAPAKAPAKQRTKLPQCPAYLDAVARAEWQRLVRILRRDRGLKEGDYIALANLCQSYSNLITAQTALSKGGLLYQAQTGAIHPSPLLLIVGQCSRTVTRLCREFGLTPLSHGRLGPANSETPAEEDSTLDGRWGYTAGRIG